MELRATSAPVVPTDDRALTATQRASAPMTNDMGNEEMRRIAQEFEAMVLTEMLQPMFANLDTDGIGGGGAGERMFRPMLIQQYADAMSKNGGVGVAEAVLREMVRMQEGGNDGADR